MFQSEKAMGMEPAVSSCDPSYRAATEKVTRCVIPCIASRPVALAVKIALLAGAEPKSIGLVRVKTASGWLAVSRIPARPEGVLPPAVTVLRSTRNVAAETWAWAMRNFPVTAVVRATKVPCCQRKSSGTRYPADDPFATVQVPSTEELPAAAGVGLAGGRTSAAGTGPTRDCTEMNPPATTSTTTPARVHRNR